MAAVTKRCAVCEDPIPPASIFCSTECQQMARVLRNAQPPGDEQYEFADSSEYESARVTAELLQTAGAQHRTDLAVILAAYQRKQLELDALIWAAHSRGMHDRDIGIALEMRTSSVRRRVLAFKSRFYGPVGGTSTPAVAG